MKIRSKDCDVAGHKCGEGAPDDQGNGNAGYGDGMNQNCGAGNDQHCQHSGIPVQECCGKALRVQLGWPACVIHLYHVPADHRGQGQVEKQAELEIISTLAAILDMRNRCRKLMSRR